ncbi:MAG: hypothetical protein MHPSP_004290, partial [Paramarteilia canceri]
FYLDILKDIEDEVLKNGASDLDLHNIFNSLTLNSLIVKRMALIVADLCEFPFDFNDLIAPKNIEPIILKIFYKLNSSSESETFNSHSREKMQKYLENFISLFPNCYELLKIAGSKDYDDIKEPDPNKQISRDLILNIDKYDYTAAMVVSALLIKCALSE